MNMINFDDRNVLVWPSVADKGKGKEIIIGDTREAVKNIKYSCRKVVTEKSLDGGESLKITITTSNTRGRHRHVARRDPLFCAPQTVRRIDTDGPGHRRTVRVGQVTVRQRPGAATTTYFQTSMTRNRYVEDKHV
jgi:hypothetical protein